MKTGISEHFSTTSQTELIGKMTENANNKIPEYAREYKREYLFVKGLNLQFGYFNKKLEYLNDGLFETELAKEIKIYMKGFLRRQKENKFKNLANIIYFPDNFLDHIYFMNQNFDCYKLRYDAFCDDGKDYNDYLSDTSDTSDDEDDDVEYSYEYIEYKKEYLVDGKPYPGFIEFYDIFKQIFNQIKKDNESDIDIDEIIESDGSDIDINIDNVFDDDIDINEVIESDSDSDSGSESESESEDDSDYYL